jgi:hypothetical protein
MRSRLGRLRSTAPRRAGYIVALMAALLVAPSAAQAGTLDQQQTNTGGGATPLPLAQTFTAGISGELDRVDLNVVRAAIGTTDPLTVEIRNVDAGGAPGSTVLASASVPAATVPFSSPGWVEVTFASPAVVQAGTQYAIVVAPDPYGWWRSGGGGYAGGSAFMLSAAAWREYPVFDMAFKTYVTPPDTTPPTITCLPSPSVIWSPQHKLVPIGASVSAGDDSGSVSVTLVSVTSSQADSGLDAEDVPGDIQDWVIGTDDRSGLLRAERVERARTYTLTYQAEDASGNTATCHATVTVPKSQGPS